MNEIVQAKGIVLSAMPIGEQDKRLVLETCEFGKITAFARGCRRAGSPLLAAANPFVTGTFSLIPGRSAWRLTDAEATEYFRELAVAQPGVYVGFYFLELVDYYGREGIDGTDMLNLLYVSLKALLRPELPLRLVRRIFELRLLAMNGEYAPEAEKMSESLFSICNYIVQVPLGRLYSFQVSEQVLIELEKIVERALRQTIDRDLKSKKIMEAFLAPA